MLMDGCILVGNNRFKHYNKIILGDIVYLDKAGNLFIVDRIKELIKVSGFQVGRQMTFILCLMTALGCTG
jgi:hypothetical protein